MLQADTELRVMKHFSTHSWFCSFIDTKRPSLEMAYSLSFVSFYFLFFWCFNGEFIWKKAGWEGVQSVSQSGSLRRRQTADLIGCQSVENRKRFSPLPPERQLDERQEKPRWKSSASK